MSIEKPVNQVNKGQEMWQTLEDDKFIEMAGEMDEVLRAKDVDRTQKILQDPQALRSLVLRRGQGGENLERLENMSLLVIREFLGPDKDLENLETADFRSLIKSGMISEYVVGNLLSAAFHERDGVKFYRLYSLIMENADMFTNQEVVENARHDLASWLASAEGDNDRALKVNQQVFHAAKLNDLRILSNKAEFGIAKQKGLKPRDQADKFSQITQDLEGTENKYDAQRARIEEIKARLELARRQKNPRQKNQSPEYYDNIERAINLVKQVGKYLQEHKYDNLEVLFWEAQAKIAVVSGDKRREGQFWKRAEELRRKIDYRS